jgi:hypothetical protein
MQHMREMRNACKIFVGKYKWKRYLGVEWVDGGIILRLILRKFGVKIWTEVKILKMNSAHFLL